MDTIEAKRETLKELLKQFKSIEKSKIVKVLSPYKTEIRELRLKKKATFSEISDILKQISVEVSPKAVGQFYRTHIQKSKLKQLPKEDV